MAENTDNTPDSPGDDPKRGQYSRDWDDWDFDVKGLFADGKAPGSLRGSQQDETPTRADTAKTGGGETDRAEDDTVDGMQPIPADPADDHAQPGENSQGEGSRPLITPRPSLVQRVTSLSTPAVAVVTVIVAATVILTSFRWTTNHLRIDALTAMAPHVNRFEWALLGYAPIALFVAACTFMYDSAWTRPQRRSETDKERWQTLIERFEQRRKGEPVRPVGLRQRLWEKSELRRRYVLLAFGILTFGPAIAVCLGYYGGEGGDQGWAYSADSVTHGFLTTGINFSIIVAIVWLLSSLGLAPLGRLVEDSYRRVRRRRRDGGDRYYASSQIALIVALIVQVAAPIILVGKVVFS